jgi:exodeoxyribonuclease VII small subunit
MAELEAILDELESDELDVDVLADRVGRASELIKSCRARIARAQSEVEGIVTDLEDFDGGEGGDDLEDDEAEAEDEDEDD